ncbi:MAG: hypothetical protein D6816_00615 [Bacteroidetes bacterium]|nr:MAG: hypothetical protein D6816_00615 [Bacteroidota bacterium]
MRLYVANTDYDWYRHLIGLANQPGGLDEVNFWRPSGKQVVGYLQFGDPFVFKLKKAHGHAIVGFGFWVAFARLSVQEAWLTFGEKNGAPSLDAVWRRVARYVPGLSPSTYRPSHPIGCDLLASPVFSLEKPGSVVPPTGRITPSPVRGTTCPMGKAVVSGRPAWSERPPSVLPCPWWGNRLHNPCSSRQPIPSLAMVPSRSSAPG